MEESARLKGPEWKMDFILFSMRLVLGGYGTGWWRFSTKP